ncbi:MAG: acetyl-CoA C-acyltransferase [Candidatus Krumholzibacteria bacterium]|nr:acetyl-CoA C-acyltransferase [Candidatus Krumholzibacteria bacterium]
MKKCVILGGARTPMAEWIGGKTGSGDRGGKFAGLSAIDLGALAATAALERTNVEPSKIEHVVMGNALQTSGDAIYGARHVGLKSGVPKEVPALTVNRLCGSGIQAVIDGVYVIGDGASYTLCGGMESMSQAPHVIRGVRAGIRLGHARLEDSLLEALTDSFCHMLMAQTAEKLAIDRDISRGDQDQFALRSVQRGAEAIRSGRFAEEIVPVEVSGRKGSLRVDTDDHLYQDATLEGLARLVPAFGKDGYVTAGNASGMVDGAACLVVADESASKRDGHQPLTEIIGWHTVGVAPEIMGIGPVEAIKGLLAKTRVKLEDIDIFEINEAFAAQYLAVEKDLGLDRERVNPNGGAIALGHPLGATGARLLLTLSIELNQSGKRYGIASACIGGGQGIAMLLKNCKL